jgi:hypothetical protein
MGEAWRAETQSARPHKLRARERQTRISAIAQLPEKRKNEPRYPHLFGAAAGPTVQQTPGAANPKLSDLRGSRPPAIGRDVNS